MSKLTIKKQMFLFASFMLALQITISIIGYKSLHGIKDNLYSVFKKRLPSIDNLVQADRDFQQALVAERTLLISGLNPEVKKALANEYKKNRAQVLERFSDYEKLAESTEEKQIIKEFHTNLETWHKDSDTYLGLDSNGEFTKKLSGNEHIQNSMGVVNASFESSRSRLDKLQELIQNMGAKEFEEATHNFKRGSDLILIFSLATIFLSLLISWLSARKISKRVEEVADYLSKSNDDLNLITSELSEKSSSLASVSHEQASSVVETSASLHEISEMVKNNTLNAEKSEELVKESERLINGGIDSVKKLSAGIKGVEDSSEEIMTSVKRNNQELEKIISAFHAIKEKANVINDIVFQTKLLSFNASVEAARAGEHGKGFSVVAEEVGKLAQMSGSSADEITTLLEDSLSQVSQIIETSKSELEKSVMGSKEKVDRSVELSEVCHDAFLNISQKFIDISNASNEVVHASREQHSGVEEINKAMQEINTSSSVTGQSASDVEISSNQLASIVTTITKNIEGLEELVGRVKKKKSVKLQKVKSVKKIETDDWEDIDAA